MSKFEEDKNAKELGIDTTKKFVVVNELHNDTLTNGDILKLIEDDNSDCPRFERISDGFKWYFHWYRLEYAEPVEDELRTPKVGDWVRIIKSDGLPEYKGKAKVTSTSITGAWFNYETEDGRRCTNFYGDDSLMILKDEYEFCDAPPEPVEETKEASATQSLDKIIVHCEEKWMYEKLVELVPAGRSQWNPDARQGFRIEENSINDWSLSFWYENIQFKDYEKLHFNDFMDKYFPQEMGVHCVCCGKHPCRKAKPTSDEEPLDIEPTPEGADKSHWYLMGRQLGTSENIAWLIKEFGQYEYKPTSYEKPYYSQYYGMSLMDMAMRDSKYLNNYKPKNTLINKTKKAMCDVSKVIRQVGRSAETKILIEYGCIDENKNWTRDGLDAVLNLEAKSREFESFSEMRKKYCSSTDVFSVDPFYLDTMVQLHKEELIKQLKADKADRKKNK